MGSVVSGWGTAAREEVSRAARKSITLGGGAKGFLPDAWPGFSNVDVMLVLCSYGDDSSRIMENKFPVGTFGSFEWWNDCFTGKLPRKTGRSRHISFRPIPWIRFVWGSASHTPTDRAVVCQTGRDMMPHDG